MPRDAANLSGSPPIANPTDADRRHMRRALRLARAAAAIGETPVGAVVYDTATGAVLSEAANRREHDADPCAHAELMAIRAAAALTGDWRLNHCTLVVTLEPCPMCAGAIVNARVGRLVYGAADPKAGAVASLYEICTDSRFNHRVIVVAGVMAKSSAALLQEFFRARRGKVKPPKPRRGLAAPDQA